MKYDSDEGDGYMRTLNNKLNKVFDTPNKKAFIGFLTAGDPTADCTVNYILEMERAD